jgi:hypothetical protein
VSGGVPKDAQESLILDTAKVSSFPPTSSRSRNRHRRAPHSFAPNSCAKDRAPNNCLPKALMPKALPGAGCQTDYRQKLPDILVAPVLAHTYGLQELALPDTTGLLFQELNLAKPLPQLRLGPLLCLPRRHNRLLWGHFRWLALPTLKAFLTLPTSTSNMSGHV